MNYTVIYNPHADNGNGKENASRLSALFPSDVFEYTDATAITDYKTFFTKLSPETNVVLCGGDGTLNRFVNDTKSVCFNQEIYYFPCGSGNDFARDIKSDRKLIPVRDYIRHLPIVCVNGKEYRFVNGVGFGIDGYCCETGDEIRKKKPKKKINYTSIAIKGLLFSFKPTQATVIVNGKKYSYKKTWLAPTMYGKYYGGGMMPAPDQTRENPDGKISVMIFHGCGKLKALCLFPGIFSGKHVKKKKYVSVFSGNEITVKFDRPRALQIDGETIKNVTEYTVKSAYAVASEKRKERLI